MRERARAVPARGRSIRELRERLVRAISGLGGAVVALSGGVDSSVLAALAAEALGGRAVAATVSSEVHRQRDLEDARAVASRLGVRHVVLEDRALGIDGFAANGPDRCYLCRRRLAELLWGVARREGLGHVLEGTTATEAASEDRPGLVALREAGVTSPFLELGVGKDEVRALARSYGLHLSAKPSSACLASRFPHGERLTPAALALVEPAEDAVQSLLGASQVRVRVQGASARIELDPDALASVLAGRRARALTETVIKLKSLGFGHVALDLEVYRPGGADAPGGRARRVP